MDSTRVAVDVRQVAIMAAVMSDYPKEPLDLAVMHGLSQGMHNCGNLFLHTKGLWNAQIFKNLAVVGGDGTGAGNTPNAWIGPEATIQQLVDVGFDKKDILVTDKIIHSKAEAVAILKMARENKWTSVGSITVNYHGGRMLPYMVAAMQEAVKEGNPWWIKYHMLPPPTTDSFMDIMGSQGLSWTNCIKATMDDAVKIEDHIEKGFAASFDDVLYYLQHRDKIVETQSWNF